MLPQKECISKILIFSPKSKAQDLRTSFLDKKFLLELAYCKYLQHTN